MSKQALLLLVVGTLIRVPALVSPISEGYRNAQTAALTAGMIENGQLRLDPIAPWRGDLDARLAMELPLYNLAALAINALPGMRLDTAGRLASLIFWILSFLALQALWRRTLPPQAAPWANLLFIFSPMNWYLSTAFMPESLLQFLAIGFMVSALAYAQGRSWSAFGWMFITGMLGLLIKFPSFLHLGLFAVLLFFDRGGKQLLRHPVLIFSGGFVVASLAAWSAYTQHINKLYFADWSGFSVLMGFIRPEVSRISVRYYLPLVGYNAAFITTLVAIPFIAIGVYTFVRTFRESFISRLWTYLFASLAFYWLVWGMAAPVQNYYNLPNLVFFCAAFSVGICRAKDYLLAHQWQPRWVGIGGSLVVLATVALSVAGYAYLARPDRVSVAAAAWARENTSLDDIIIFQPRHLPNAVDYQHQPLVPYLSERRCFIWTRNTPDWERLHAAKHADSLIITNSTNELGLLEKLRLWFRGSVPKTVASAADVGPRTKRLVYRDCNMSIFRLD